MQQHYRYNILPIVFGAILIIMLCAAGNVFAAHHDNNGNHGNDTQAPAAQNTTASTQSPATADPAPTSPANDSPAATPSGNTQSPATSPASTPSTTDPSQPNNPAPPSPAAVDDGKDNGNMHDHGNDENQPVDTDIYNEIIPTVVPSLPDPPSVITHSEFDSAIKSAITKNAPQLVDRIHATKFTTASNYYTPTGFSATTTRNIEYTAYGMALVGLIMIMQNKRVLQKFTA